MLYLQFSNLSLHSLHISATASEWNNILPRVFFILLIVLTCRMHLSFNKQVVTFVWLVVFLLVCLFACLFNLCCFSPGLKMLGNPKNVFGCIYTSIMRKYVILYIPMLQQRSRVHCRSVAFSTCTVSSYMANEECSEALELNTSEKKCEHIPSAQEKTPNNPTPKKTKQTPTTKPPPHLPQTPKIPLQNQRIYFLYHYFFNLQAHLSQNWKYRASREKNRNIQTTYFFRSLWKDNWSLFKDVLAKQKDNSCSWGEQENNFESK